MNTDTQDPIKVVFCHVNQALLRILATSDVQELQRLQSSIQVEIANLSRNIAHVFNANVSIPDSGQLRERNGPGSDPGLLSLPGHRRTWATPGDHTWAQCNLFFDSGQQQYPTHTSIHRPSGDTRHTTLHPSHETQDSTTWVLTPESHPAHTRNLNSPSSVSGGYHLDLELTNGLEDIDTSLRAGTRPFDDSSEPISTSHMQQNLLFPLYNIKQDAGQVLEEYLLPPDIHGTVVESFNASKVVSDTGEAWKEDSVAFMGIDASSQQTSTHSATSNTPRKLKQLGRIRGRRQHDVNSSKGLHKQVNMQGTLRKLVTTDKDHILDLLTRLTHVIGNAESLLQLKASISVARLKDTAVNPSHYGTHDLAYTMQALDMLDTASHRSAILRRYYLVRLLRHRLKSEARRLKEREETKYHDKMSNSLTDIKWSTSSTNVTTNRVAAHGTLSVQEKPTRIVRADSQALQDMMKLLYPHLKPLPTDIEKDNDLQYKRLLSKLKNRLACARNWHQFAEHYSIGILAVIPSGCKSGISSDQIEKLPASIVASYLEFLKQVKGSCLKEIGLSLSEHVFEILSGGDGGRKSYPVYTLEECDDSVILQAEGNPKMLQDLCRTVEVECDQPGDMCR